MNTKLVGALFSFAVVAAFAACSSSSSTTTVASDGGTNTEDASVVGDAGPATGCTGGQKVRFALTTGSAFCSGAEGGCNNTIFTVKKSDGTVLLGGSENSCVSSCDTCVAIGCPALCPAPTPIPDTGATGEWDGTFYTPSTCGENDMACAVPQCAAPGTYVVKMCAIEATPDGGGGVGPDNSCPGAGGTPICTEQTFEWPPSADAGVITGAIGFTK